MTTLKQRVKNNLVYFIPADKWILRHGGKWELASSFNKEGVKHYLRSQEFTELEIKEFFDQTEYRSVLGFRMAPGQKPFFKEHNNRFVNLWKTPRLTSAPGEFPAIQTILDFMTKGDKEGQRWILHWLAQKIQHPGLLPKVALVFTSQQAGGKGTLTHVIREMLGLENTSIISQTDLESNFNDNWVFKLFVLGDEVLSSDRRKDISNQLKMFIDTDELILEGKYKNKISVRNQISWMFASNAKTTPLVLEQSDRRYTVFTNFLAPPPGYRDLLEGLWDLHEKGKPNARFDSEIMGFKHMLENLEVDYQFIKRPYENEDRRKLIEASLPSYEHFFNEIRAGKAKRWLDKAEDTLGFEDKKLAAWDGGDLGVSIDYLFKAYVVFCKHSQSRHIKLTNFTSALDNESSPWECTTKDGERYVKIPR